MKGIFTVSIFRVIVVLALSLVVTKSWAQIDLSLSKGISNSAPSIGTSVTYTLTVRNNGFESATGVTVKDSLPSGGVSYASHEVIRGGGNYNSGLGLWTIGSIAAGDSAVITVEASVLAAGVFFSVAEIASMNEADEDSRPGDGTLNQDDIAVACFSVPIEWSLGDEYTLSIPSGYKSVKWLYGGKEIVGSVVVNGKTIAVVNGDSSLTVKGPGSFSFDAKVGGLCPASGCCAFEIVPAAAGSIGDLVWYDDNNNGILDETEEGVAGVTVKLFDCENVRLATTITDQAGRYLFSDLATGSYKVVFTQPSGAGFSKNGLVDSKGATNCITIDTSLPDTSALRNNPTIDAAIVRYGSIGNYAWNDANSNGVKDADEEGIAGITVKLLNEASKTLATTITDETGTYLFDSLVAGTYRVKFIAPTGQRFTNGIGTDGLSAAVTPNVSAEWLSPERDIRTVNAGLSDAGFYDLAVSLALENGQAATVQPGDTVSYELIIRNLGGFSVKEIQLLSSNTVDLAWTNSLPVVTDTLNAGDSLSIILQAVVSPEFTGENLTAHISIASYLSVDGQETIDAIAENNTDSVSVTVEKLYGSIGSLVWYDDNNNGVKDAGEQLAAGVTINLLTCEDEKITTTISDENGNYSFSELASGSYKLKFVKPSNSIFNSDGPVNESGTTDCIIIDTKSLESTSSKNNLAVNVGIVRLATIRGLAWKDSDKDGSNNNEEIGNEGITVELLDSTSVVLTSIKTNSNGEYSFDSLTAGSYFVRFLAPTGEYFTNSISSEGLSSKIEIDFTQNSEQNKIVDAGLAPVEVAPEDRYDLAISTVLSSGQSIIQPGDTVSYQVTVRNVGDLAVSQIELANTLASELALQGDAVTVLNGPLNAGDSIQFVNRVVVSPEFLKGTLIAATQISSFKKENSDDAVDSNLINNRDSVSIEVEKRYGSIGSLVWNDTNGDGVKDAEESGIAGVTVQLRDTITSVLATAITGEAGTYLFDSLSAGTYRVKFIAPSDYKFTNGITETGFSASIALDVLAETGDPKRDVRTVNAGLILNEVTPEGYYDLSLSASLSSGQPSTVQPGDTVNYQITIFNKGELAVKEVELENILPAALTMTGDVATTVAGPLNPGDSIQFVNRVVVSPKFLKGILIASAKINSFKSESGVAALDSNLLNNGDSISIAVEKNYGSIGSLVWNDANGDGIKDAGEEGIPGVTVQLRDTLTSVLATTITNSTGEYLFDSLSSGIYRVKFVSPSDYKYTNGISEQGFSNKITLDVLANVEDSKRNNFTVNAGLVLVCDSVSIELLANQIVCAGDSVLLSAISNKADASITWYTSLDATVPAFVTGNGDTLKVSSAESSVYYAEATRTNGCISERVKLELTVGTQPAAPVVAGSFENSCPETSFTLAKIELPAVAAEGNVFEWHASIEPTSEIVSDSIPVSGSYYLFEKTATGCYSQPTLVVINTVACDCDLTYGVNASEDQEVCNQQPITVSAELTGASKSIVWSTSGTGVFVNQDTLVTNYLPSQEDITAGTVTLTATASVDSSASCGPKSDALVVTILPAPAPVYGIALDDTLICAGQRTDLVAFATGDSIKWYTDIEGGIAFATTRSGYPLTVAPNETTTYYAEVIKNNGCHSDRVAITLLVERCSSELAVVKKVITPGPYAPGKEVTYSIEVTNKGEGNARDIIVEDVLPAGLIYTSSVPANVYDLSDGVWTIGSMATQETRTLLINTTLSDSAEGAIKNIAVVKSSAIDSVRSFSDTSSVTIDVSYLADLSLVLKGSKSNVAVGDTVTYTAEVSNAGPLAATNVEVVAKLPAELEFVSSERFTLSGDLLKATLDSVLKDQTKQLTFLARVIENGLHTTLAQVNHSDQKDPDSTPGNGFENGEDDESAVAVSAGCDSLAAPLIACAKTNVCAGATVFLTAAGCANGTVKWSNGMTGDNIKITANETIEFTALCQEDKCISDASNSITVYVNTPEVPVLTSDMSSVCAGGSATLSASNCSGTVVWSTSEETASILVTPTESTTYTAYCKAGNCVSETASITINSSKPAAPVVECGCSNASICPGESVLLSALHCAGVVKWSNGMSGQSITVSPGVTTDYRAVCVVNGCESDSSKLHTVKVVTPQKPEIIANKTTVCPASTVILSATGCAGTVVWSNNMTGDSISVKLNSSQSFSAVCKSNACASERSNTVAIKVVTPSAPIISTTKTVVCSGDSVNLKAIGCAGTVVWSTGQEGASVFINPTETKSYTATCKLDDCASNVSNSVKVNVNTSGTAPVIATAKTDICAGESVAITASGCAGTVQWSNGMTGNRITVAPVSGETYYAICKGQEACASGASNKITFNLNLAKPVTKAIANVCPSVVVNLNDAVTSAVSGVGGTFIFRTGATNDAALVTNPKAVGVGTYYVSERSAAGCVSEATSIVVVIESCGNPEPVACATNPATANAGSDQTVCADVSYQLHGSIGGSATSATWTTNGKGTFSDATSLNALYYPANEDFVNGKVILTLTTNDPDGEGACVAASDEVEFTIEAINFQPIITINGTPKTDELTSQLTICAGEFVTLAVADVEAGKYTYKWNDGNSSASSSFVVRESGTYFVSLVTANGCVSQTSARVIVNVTTPATPVTKVVTNNCPATTVDLTTAITSEPGVGGVFEYHTGNTLTSDLVATPEAAAPGNYYVFEKSATGCYSAPAVIDVDILDCTVEIGVALTTTAVSYNGDGSFDITYQAIIKNKGAGVLTNIEAVDSLSSTFGDSQFSIITAPSATSGSTLSVNTAFNGTSKPNLLNPVASSLAVGKTDTLTFVVKVAPKEVEKIYYNSIVTKGQIGEKVSVALSNNGVNPDEVTGDPTPVELITEIAPIGVALAVKDTVPQIDGSYDVTYQVTIKNYGSATNLSNVIITNDLNEVFNSGNGASFKKVGTPIVSSDSKLVVNPDFDGKTKVELLVAETSSLAASVADTVWFTINVKTDGREDPYLNSVTVFAKSGDMVVTDVSTDGLNPAPNETNDPAESNEATPVVLPLIIDKVFIPEGFSPNGDGINDLFVIENTDGQKVSLEIYSRWMTMVYKNDDYKNDWNGTSNSGIRLGNNASGLPDGTYFYVVKLANGKRYMRSMTLTR